MATLETAYYCSIPFRYAVGRWYNISPATLLAYNAADLGLSVLEYRIMSYFDRREREIIPQSLIAPFLLTSKIVYCLAAVYVTSKLTDPMPLEAAELTTVASFVSTIAAAILLTWSKKK
jgi:hypothetical protein